MLMAFVHFMFNAYNENQTRFQAIIIKEKYRRKYSDSSLKVFLNKNIFKGSK